MALISAVAQISARSVPARTTSAPARLPHSSYSASTMIDLPAPVSPVSTVSPGLNSSSTASIIAKSRICRWRSTASALVRQSADTPMQLGAQQPEVVVARRMQQRNRAPGGGDLEPAARIEFPELGGVAVDLRPGTALATQADIDSRLAGYDDRAVRQRVRTDRRHHQHVEAGIDDRTPPGQRVGGRAGRGGHPHAVTAMRIDIATIDARLEIQHAAGFEPIEYHVIEREAANLGTGGVDQPRLQQHATIRLVVAREHSRKARHHVLWQHVGQEAEAAAIDAQQRYFMAGHQARGI